MSLVTRRQPRSKGCIECIQRHVKCDERSHHCRQCLRFGLSCSGPIQGPIILDMTDKVSRRGHNSGPKATAPGAQGGARDPIGKSDPGIPDVIATGISTSVITPNTSDILSEPSVTDATSPLSPSCFTHTEDDIPVSTSSSASASPSLDGWCASKRGRYVDLQLQLAQLEQFYGCELFEEHFVSQFVSFVVSTRGSVASKRSRTWLLSLPDFLSHPATPSVKYCIRAAALAYYSTIYHDKSAERMAVEWYLAGLESHRKALTHLCTASDAEQPDDLKPQRIPEGQDICVPLMFMYFECMKGAGAAWIRHMAAAIEMLLVRGPSKCQTGHEHAMFRSIRPYEAFRAILSGERSKLDAQEWCAIPFAENAKIPLDYIVDFLLSLPRQLDLPRGKPLRDFLHNIPTLSSAAQSALETRIYNLLHELQNWQWYFEKSHGIDSDAVVHHLDATTVISTCERPLSSSSAREYWDTLTALTTTVYDAVSIVLYSILLAVATAKPPSVSAIAPISRYRSCIFSHASSILSAANFQNFVDPYCGDTTRTSFPAQIVVLFGVDDAQRLEAQKYIDLWGHNHEVGSVVPDPSFGALEA